MDNCACGGCTCGQGIQIETPDTNLEEFQFESHNINNNLWRTPTVFPNTDGNIDE